MKNGILIEKVPNVTPIKPVNTLNTIIAANVFLNFPAIIEITYNMIFTQNKQGKNHIAPLGNFP